jgi:hypothetical protein
MTLPKAGKKILMSILAHEFLDTAIRRMLYYKDLGDKTFAQLNEEDIHFRPGEESNSVAIIVKHMHGNMISRWTNFLKEDGEKSWRDRDAEFGGGHETKEDILQLWEEGWNCFLSALRSLEADDLVKPVRIRNEELTVVDAINRQLAHYPYHIGQIIFIGKMRRDARWKNHSIPRGDSQRFNDSGGIKDPARKF